MTRTRSKVFIAALIGDSLGRKRSEFKISQALGCLGGPSCFAAISNSVRLARGR